MCETSSLNMESTCNKMRLKFYKIMDIHTYRPEKWSLPRCIQPSRRIEAAEIRFLRQVTAYKRQGQVY